MRVATTSGLATTAEVVRRLERTGLDVSSLQLRQPSLDEVFLALTGQPPTARRSAEERASADPNRPRGGPDERRRRPH